MLVELVVGSLGRKIKQELPVFRVKQVTGGLKSIHKNKHNNKWN